MHIDLRQLRHLIALAEHRSFVAAAGAVKLSQSAFSRSIQALEQSVGCQLVEPGEQGPGTDPARPGGAGACAAAGQRRVSAEQRDSPVQ